MTQYIAPSIAGVSVQGCLYVYINIYIYIRTHTPHIESHPATFPYTPTCELNVPFPPLARVVPLFDEIFVPNYYHLHITRSREDTEIFARSALSIKVLWNFGSSRVIIKSLNIKLFDYSLGF